jgi:hypothetical protein
MKYLALIVLVPLCVAQKLLDGASRLVGEAIKWIEVRTGWLEERIG